MEVDENEKAVLRLPPKISIIARLDQLSWNNDIELGNAKLRYQLRKEIEERIEDEEGNVQELDEDEEERNEEIEARSRQIFDPEKKVFDQRNRRCTDLKENLEVVLPKPLGAREEACIEMRRGVYEKIFNDFKKKNCDKRGKQKTNLTEPEEMGIKSLEKRIEAEEILVVKTDKSNRLAVIKRADYLEMGRKSIENDKEVSRKEIIEKEKILNGHSRMWCKMQNMGENWNHESKIIDS